MSKSFKHVVQDSPGTGLGIPVKSKKCSYRAIIIDNTSVLYFGILKIAEYLLKQS